MTTWPYRKQWFGYTNIGTIQIPPPPKYIILTDRADGETLWWLTFDTVQYPYPDGLGLMGITNVPPWPSGIPGDPNNDPTFVAGTWPTGTFYGNTQVYTPYNEPWINLPGAAVGKYGYLKNVAIRLVVVGGYLGMETIPATVGTVQEANQRIFGLNVYPGFNAPMREVILAMAYPGMGWQNITVTQTPNPPTYVPSFSQQDDD
jgi:hypothetical protein